MVKPTEAYSKACRLALAEGEKITLNLPYSRSMLCCCDDCFSDGAYEERSVAIVELEVMYLSSGQNAPDQPLVAKPSIGGGGNVKLL